MVETGIVSGFKVLIIVMLFYSVSITLLTYSLEDLPTAQAHLLPYSELSEEVDLEGVSTDIQESFTQQTNIPVIEVGALVYYSGNILVDLLVNFAYALPQMLGLLVHAITWLFNLDNYIWVTVQSFAAILVTAMYVIGLIQLLTGIRSGRIV